jgi:hypothetical protein
VNKRGKNLWRSCTWRQTKEKYKVYQMQYMLIEKNKAGRRGEEESLQGEIYILKGGLTGNKVRIWRKSISGKRNGSAQGLRDTCTECLRSYRRLDSMNQLIIGGVREVGL